MENVGVVVYNAGEEAGSRVGASERRCSLYYVKRDGESREPSYETSHSPVLNSVPLLVVSGSHLPGLRFPCFLEIPFHTFALFKRVSDSSVPLSS